MAVVTDLGPEDAEQIARALSEVLQCDIMSDWVEITKDRAAGRYIVTVVQEDVMGKVREYLDPPGYASIKEPMRPCGWRLNGKHHDTLRLNQHGQWIGMSTSGKSSIIQCAMAYATRCVNPARPDTQALIWLGGNQKLSDLAWSWVKPYYNTGLPCPIDWIAHGTKDTLDMMATAMRVARFRQSIDPDQRGPWPTIILILDETSFLMEDYSAWIQFGGKKMFCDTMGADIVRGASSGDVAAMFATQFDVNACFGDKGNILQAQLKYTGGFQINEKDAYGRMFGDWKLKPPESPGEFWLKDGESGLPFRLKAPYIQTDDKTKPVLHSGLKVSDVAASRQHLWTPAGPPQLDPRSTTAAGPEYANRRRLVDDAFMRYLSSETSAIVITRPPQAAAPSAEETENEESGRRDDGIPQVDRDLAASLAKAKRMGIEIPADYLDDPGLAALVEEAEQEYAANEAAVNTDGATVTSLVDRRTDRTTWAERIELVLRANPDRSMTRQEIIADLTARGWAVDNPQVITNTLGRMRVVRDDQGYRAL